MTHLQNTAVLKSNNILCVEEICKICPPNDSSLSPHMDSSLYKAIRSGDIAQLKQIASSDDDLLLQMTTLKNTVLHVAVQFNRIECVEEICKRCPSSLLTQTNSKGDTPLHVAARLGLSEIASFLINQSKKVHHHEDIESGGGSGGVELESSSAVQQLVRMRSKENDTPLHEAVRNCRCEVVKLLTEADPTFEYLECNNAGETPLYLAAEIGLYNSVLQILQTSPSSAHGGPLGRTALHASVICERSDITKLLLDKKLCLIKEVDDYGCSALHYAAYFGMSETVVQLLDTDSSVAYMFNKDGKTALHLAASRHNSTEIIEALTRRCPDCWDLLDKEGKNFLHVAAEKGKYNVVENIIRQENMMVENLINQPDNNGNTPLHLATMSGSLDTVKILSADNRVNKDAMNKDSSTPMCFIYNNLINGNHSEFILEACDNLIKASARRSSRKQLIIEEKEIDKPGSSHPNDNDTRQKHVEAIEKERQTRLLVAALIATVTFAAGFTLPGGYNSDGPHKGMATLAKIPAFITFMIFNTIAMLLSTFTIFIHFWVKYGYHVEFDKVRDLSLRMEYWCTFYAIIGMVIAFVTGTYAVLFHSPGLATLICILGCSFFLLCGFLFYKAYKLRGLIMCGYMYRSGK